jgi:hypothetical protein
VCLLGLVWGDVWRCDGDGRPALGRAGAGVCSGVRGLGVPVCVYIRCRCGRGCVHWCGSSGVSVCVCVGGDVSGVCLRTGRAVGSVLCV